MKLVRDVQELNIKLNTGKSSDLNELITMAEQRFSFYLSIERDMYMETQKKVLESCNLVLDGMEPIDVIASRLVEVLKTYNRKHNCQLKVAGVYHDLTGR